MELNNWINEIGFQTEMEKEFGKYCVDIWIPEINSAVELDGYGHWPKKDQKRDYYLKQNFGIEEVIHIKYKDCKKSFVKQIICEVVEKKYGKK